MLKNMKNLLENVKINVNIKSVIGGENGKF